MSGAKRVLTFVVGFNFVRYMRFTDGVAEVPASIATAADNYDVFLESLARIVRQQRDPIDGIAFSFPGFVDVRRQVVTTSWALRKLSGHRIGDDLNELLRSDIPVWMENDANCVALAEKNRGNARRYDDFALLTITDTGMGGALVLDGRLRRGRQWRAGEFGMFIPNHATAGLRTMHEYTSLDSIATRYAERFGVPREGIVPASLLRRVDEPEVGELVRDWASYVGAAIFNVIATIDPECVLVGGPVCQEMAFMPLIKEAVESHPSWRDFRVPIKRCRYASGAEFYGAYDAFMTEVGC